MWVWVYMYVCVRVRAGVCVCAYVQTLDELCAYVNKLSCGRSHQDRDLDKQQLDEQ